MSFVFVRYSALLTADISTIKARLTVVVQIIFVHLKIMKFITATFKRETLALLLVGYKQYTVRSGYKNRQIQT